MVPLVVALAVLLAVSVTALSVWPDNRTDVLTWSVPWTMLPPSLTVWAFAVTVAGFFLMVKPTEAVTLPLERLVVCTTFVSVMLAV